MGFRESITGCCNPQQSPFDEYLARYCEARGLTEAQAMEHELVKEIYKQYTDPNYHTDYEKQIYGAQIGEKEYECEDRAC